MKKIPQQWQDIFYFTPPERRGLALLCGLIATVFAGPAVIPADFPSEKDRLTAGEEAWLDAQSQVLAFKPADAATPPVKWSRNSIFNPNEVTKDELLKAGCPERIAHNWSRYLEKGGRFRRVEDVRRIYGMTDALFEQIKPFVRLEKMHVFSRPPKFGDRHERIMPRPCREIDINQADSLDWESLPGIGTVLASRIVRFRERLGGFFSLDQVGETYGLQDSVFQKLKPCLRLSPPFRKIPLNQATEEQLVAHPYISWKLARIIIAYRREHGPFQELRDLASIPALSPDDLKKLEPYLAIVP